MYINSKNCNDLIFYLLFCGVIMLSEQEVPYMKLGNNIKKLRKQFRLTQSELAEKLMVTEQTVSKWENDKCYPDISLLPVIANVFNCSVDKVLGVEMYTYESGVEKALENYEACENYEEEIEVLTEAISKFPNNNELKYKLAHSYFMAWRMSEVESRKSEFFNKVVNCCNNILCCGQNDAEFDKANYLLMRIYTENGDYEKALRACNNLTIDSWKNRLVGKAQILKESKNPELRKYAQCTLFELQTAMRFICQLYCDSVIEEREYDEALTLCELQERILSLFDTDSSNLYLSEKMMLSFQTANIYKKKSQPDDIHKCLNQMSFFAKMGIEKAGEHYFSENPILSKVDEKEPYMTESETKRFVNTFLDKFVDVISAEKLHDLKI